MTRPADTDYPPFYARYIELVPEENVVRALDAQSAETQRLLASLDETHAAYRYEPGKWSVKQVIGHMNDSERIFGYRMLAIARGETQPLPGFDEELYAANANFDDWKVGDLAEHYALGRRANIVFLRNLAPDAWSRRGIANDAPVNVTALAYTIVGHERHHLSVLRDRYRI